MLVLPGLDRRFVQHSPHRAPADRLSRRRFGSPHQVGQRLAAERFFRLRDHLTSHRLNQRMIQRGKKRPSGHDQDDRRWRSRPMPTDCTTLDLSSGQADHSGRFVGKIVFVDSPLWQAPFKGIQHTVTVTGDFINQIAQMIAGAVKPQLAGPVGIVKITGEVAASTPDLGWWPILSLTAILSLNLAIINILPFPALDGGRILLILIELLRGGKRLKPEREGIINFVGMAILLTLMVIISVNDVIHWGS